MMFLRMLPLALVTAVPLFAGAGRLDVPAFYAYLSVLWLVAGATYTVALRRHPDLVAERLAPPSDRDRASRRIAIPLVLAHDLLAGLDVRYGWSVIAGWAQGGGLLLVVSGLALAGWTILTNPYASTAVRIQAERGQLVIETGPYALVRHPMYLGVLLVSCGSGPALGSWWAGFLLLPVLAVFVRRTLIEDRMLHRELAGYAAYAGRVRFKVLPGVF